MKNISLVIGSTGLIGKKLLFELDKKGDEVIAVSRRPIQGIPSNINVLVIDFNHFVVNGSFPVCDHVYICLGTTIKKAGSQREFKKVDLEYCVALAKKAKESGATRVSLISSVGADSAVRNFYLRTKGQAENAIKNLDFLSINIFRPSLLIGQRDESRNFEKIGEYLSLFVNNFLIGSLRRYRSIKADNVAYSMANAEWSDGTRYFYFDDFQNINR